jgi:hypothetical protein
LECWLDTFQLHDAASIGILAIDHDQRRILEARGLVTQPDEIA